MLKKNNPKFKNYIFDFDGTLVDSLTPFIKSASDIALELNIDLKDFDEANISKFKNMTILELLRYFNVSIFKLTKIVTYFKKIFYDRRGEILFHKGVKDVLVKLKEYNCILGILSSNSKDNINLILDREDIQVFNFVYTRNSLFGKEVDLAKIIKSNHMLKNETIYICDEYRDIKAAKKAGIVTCAVLWGNNGEKLLRRLNPEFIARSPEDLLLL